MSRTIELARSFGDAADEAHRVAFRADAHWTIRGG
jgi:hypothetical protein